METASSSICDVSLSDCQTVVTSEIRDDGTVASHSAHVESRQCSTVTSACYRTVSRRKNKKSKVRVSMKKDKGHDKLEIDLGGRIVNNTQLQQIERSIYGITDHKQLLHTEGGKKTKQEEIDHFIEKFGHSGNFSDVHVATMRHMIPLFLMVVYPQVYGQFSRKVKGMWERKPDDWPVGVMFLDPNNKMKEQGGGGSKPTKEILFPMLLHLVRKYQRQKENATCRLPSAFRRSDQMLPNASAGLDEETLFHLQPGDREESKYGSGSTEKDPSTGELSLSSAMFGLHGHDDDGHIVSSDFETETITAVAGIPCLPSIENNSSFSSTDWYDSAHSSLQTKLESGGNVVVPCHGSIPHQVEDDDEQLNWNPIEDTMRRIKCKVKFLKKPGAGSLAESDISLLQQAEDTLLRSLSWPVSEDKVPLLIGKAHIVESVIDVIKLSGCLTLEWKQKLTDYQGNSLKEQMMEADDICDLWSLPNAEAAVSPAVLQYTPLASDEDLVNQLNIEKRPTVGNSLLATTDILQVRPDVTENGNHSSGGKSCSKGAATGVQAGAAYCSEDWLMAGSQETAGALASADGRFEEPLEVDLYNFIVSNPMYDESVFLSALDKAADVQQELADSQLLVDADRQVIPSLLEDEIDGFIPFSVISDTPICDAQSYQMPQAACTSMTDHSISLSALTATPVRPITVTTDWKSLPAHSSSIPVIDTSSLSSEEQTGGYDVHYRSLPAALPDSSALQFPGAFLSKTINMASDLVSQQKANSGLLQVVRAEPARAAVKSQLPTTLVANARLMPSAAQVSYSITSVCSPVGQITGPMGGLTIGHNNSTGSIGGMSIDNNVTGTGGMVGGLSIDHNSLGSTVGGLTVDHTGTGKIGGFCIDSNITSSGGTVGGLSVDHNNMGTMSGLTIDRNSTGTMGGLSIDNSITGISSAVVGLPIDHTGSHPLLRTMLTSEATICQPAARDQRKITADQSSAEDVVASVGKRSAPIPVMVEEMDFDDGPSIKKVRSSSDSRC